MVPFHCVSNLRKFPLLEYLSRLFILSIKQPKQNFGTSCDFALSHFCQTKKHANTNKNLIALFIAENGKTWIMTWLISTQWTNKQRQQQPRAVFCSSHFNSVYARIWQKQLQLGYTQPNKSHNSSQNIWLSYAKIVCDFHKESRDSSQPQLIKKWFSRLFVLAFISVGFYLRLFFSLSTIYKLQNE